MMNKQKQLEEDEYGYWLDCDFLSGACSSYENGIKHFRYIEIAAKSDDFGFAVSHLVLGAEEMIKSLIMVCLHGDIGFINSKEKHSIFRKHDFKHFNIKDFFTSMTDKLIIDYEENYLQYYCYPEKCKNKFQPISYFLSKSLNVGEIGNEEINGLLKLIENANDIKNKGFYVDFKSDWVSPEDINRTTYLEYKALTDKLTRFIEPIFILPLTDERIMNFLYD